MLSPLVIWCLIILYAGGLFAIAQWVERKTPTTQRLARHPLVYVLCFSVFNTAWTFYGVIGTAATSGMVFLAFWLGPNLGVILGWVVIRKMTRLKDRFRITSIADLISARYGKSAAVAALATLIAMFSVIPYIALQLKAFTQSYVLITTGVKQSSSYWHEAGFDFLIAGLMITLTIIFGIRKLVPTERHPGIMVALSLEGLVKLGALLAAGIFVSYGLYNGYGDILDKWIARGEPQLTYMGAVSTPKFLTWVGYLVAGMCAVLFMPHLFHVSTVENSDERHIPKAMWIFPLYLFLVAIFILPIALGGLLLGYPANHADSFTLLLPLELGQPSLAVLMFIGGIAAGSGMVIVGTMTVSTMVVNHLLLPIFEHVSWLGFLRRWLLQCRWAAAAGIILLALWYARALGDSAVLTSFGIRAFAATTLFAPALLGGLFWKRGSKWGTMLGMSVGLFLWAYCLLIPLFAQVGWLPASLVSEGPLGISLLKPQELLGLDGLDSVTHFLFWSLSANITLYVLGSLMWRGDSEEQHVAEQFVDILVGTHLGQRRVHASAVVNSTQKLEQLQEVLSRYYKPEKARQLLDACMKALEIEEVGQIDLVHWMELESEVERTLAGAIGSAAAHSAMRQSVRLRQGESKAVAELYGEILANMRISPSELRKRIDFHREREELLTQQAEELRAEVANRTRRLETVATLSGELNAILDIDRLLDELASQVKDKLGYRDVQIYVLDQERGALVPSAREAKEGLSQGSTPLIALESEDNLVAQAARTREVTRRNSTQPAAGDQSTSSATTPYAQMAVPIISEGHIVGVLDVHQDGASGLDDNDANSLRSLANQVAVAMTNAHLFAEAQQRTRELTLVNQVAEAERRKAEAASQAKSDFLSTMSHELRTPLNGILGYAQILKKNSSHGANMTHGLDVIHQSGQHLLTLINDILDLAKIEAGKLELYTTDVYLKSFLRGIASIIQERSKEKDIVFVFEPDSQLPLGVQADETRLRQVLLNLLGNAVKFTKQGGVTFRVTLAGSGAPPQEHESAAGGQKSAPGSRRLRFAVEDTGVGMTPQQLEKIFLPFEQVGDKRARAAGTGLGLAISRDLVAAMGGDLQVSSEPGKGSTFWFEISLPLAATSWAGSQRAGSTIVGYKGQRRTILVADDKRENITILQHMLEPLGFTLMAAENGAEAVARATELRPDVILMDLVMPVMTGFEAVQAIRQQPDLEEIVIIAVSASVLERDQLKSKIAGCHGFVPKPVDESQLLAALGAYLELEWLSQDVAVEGEPEVGDGWTSGFKPSPIGSTDIVAPPPEELEALCELVMFGDIKAVEHRARELRAADGKYTAFANRIETLAKEFADEKILSLLKQYLARSE